MHENFLKLAVMRNDIKLLNGIDRTKTYGDSVDLFICISKFGLDVFRYVSVSNSTMSSTLRVITTQCVPIPNGCNDEDIVSKVNSIISKCTEMTDINKRHIVTDPDTFATIRELILSMYVGIMDTSELINGYREAARLSLDGILMEYSGGVPMLVNYGMVSFCGVNV